MDSVSQYLARQGVTVSPAYFENSQFEWGKCWDSPHWSMVYRVDENTLTICDFCSKGNTSGVSSAVLQLVEQLRHLRRSLPDIQQIRGMVIHDAGRPAQRLARQALREVLLKQGAKEVNQNGETWLVY
ncbi:MULTISPECIES: secretion protein [Shewanella]|uniref:Secretion protein n=1 Tax=Shewanella oncorhynchi TaxID=2726434 RepID=A0ABX1KU51_9GAMM|nr:MULTISPECIES: secretion protein [Shewanella]MCU7986216.1 secretion protein [Shewanella sp. SW24]MCU8032218.1 secretion protein [Shewanella sp. SM73]NLQ24632.1 secretion protein [Shewanella oncorhynchi]